MNTQTSVLRVRFIWRAVLPLLFVSSVVWMISEARLLSLLAVVLILCNLLMAYRNQVLIYGSVVQVQGLLGPHQSHDLSDLEQVEIRWRGRTPTKELLLQFSSGCESFEFIWWERLDVLLGAVSDAIGGDSDVSTTNGVRVNERARAALRKAG